MDPSDHVRQGLASVMNDMSPVLGRENTINHLLPMLLTLLRDTNPEVRASSGSGRGEGAVVLRGVVAWFSLRFFFVWFISSLLFFLPFGLPLLRQSHYCVFRTSAFMYA